MVRKLLAVIVAAVLIAGCENPNKPKPGPPVVVEDFGPQDVIVLVNAERQKAGVPPLVTNQILQNEAARYAAVMASKNTLSHTLEGDFGNRIRKAGYQGTNYGENIAFNYRGAPSLVSGWMSSPGHRANILNDKFKDTGVGIGRSSSGQPYYCQIFGRR